MQGIIRATGFQFPLQHPNLRFQTQVKTMEPQGKYWLLEMQETLNAKILGAFLTHPDGCRGGCGFVGGV